MRVDPWLLWLRALCVGLLTVVVGAVGHMTADGLLPGPWFLGIVVVVAVLLAAPMLDRPASRTRLVLMLVGGQMVVHLALTVAAGHRGDVAAPGSAAPVPTGPRALPEVNGRRVGSLQDAYHEMAGHAGSSTPSLPIGHLVADVTAHAPMMLVHLIAAALVGLWLAYGERCLWTVLALTGRRALAATWALVPVAAAPASSRTATFDRTVLAPVARWQRRPLPRRGPPVAAC
jgi:hypothetical protein